MQPTASFKRALLRHMLAGLRHVSSGDMGLLERKAAIRQAADAAMAAARGKGARWSRALLVGLSYKNKAASAPPEHGTSTLHVRPTDGRWAYDCCRRKILSRSHRERSAAWKRPLAPRRRVASASILARRMVKKRTNMLRRLVPGGDAMDGFSLLEETLDYVVSLQALAESMRSLAGGVFARPSGSPVPDQRSPEKEGLTTMNGIGREG